MPDILVRDIPQDALDRLKERAASNHRSLQAEVKAILLDSTKYSREEFLEIVDRLQQGAAGRAEPDTAELIRQGREDRARRVVVDDEEDSCPAS